MTGRQLAWLAALLWGLLAPGFAAAEERIRLFQTDLFLDRDGGFRVEERIVYSFGDAKKHGIYREIPVAYGRGIQPDYRIALDVEGVWDGDGSERPYVVSRQGRDQRIRIGDPDRTVTGEHEYRIRYRVRRGILWLDEHDELYWNATGTGWKVPIDRAEATVATPPAAGSAPSAALCFTGPIGSVETACEYATSGDMVHFESMRGFAAKEGLTVVVALPKGLLDEPSALRKWLDRARDYVGWATAAPLLLFLGMAGHWWRYGRDPSGPIATPVRYEPPEKMTPAEMGTVLDERVHLRDITSTLLDLAVRGYLRIEEVETTRFLFLSDTDYVIHRSGGDDDLLKPFELKLLDALLGGQSSVKLSSLKEQFYTSLPGIRESLYEEVSQNGKWFPTSPDAVRRRTLWIGLALALPLAVLGVALQRPALLLSMLVCAAIVGVFSRIMPRRTRAGRRACQHIRGLREFIERVEVDRLERLGLHDISHFEKLLPYAFVLGAADAWADAFAGLYTEPPRWFQSYDGDGFSANRLVGRIGRALDTAGNTMSSQPSSSSGGSGSSGFGGGGSSGGGFGGGGGGSW